MAKTQKYYMKRKMLKFENSPSKYGIYNRLPSKREKEAGKVQEHECEICFQPDTVFDHDDATGKFRGWTCRRCNLVLGLVKDDVKLLLALIHYLANH